MRRHEISESQWNRIKDLLPPERKPHGGRPAKSNREMLNAILYWLNAGIPWRDLVDETTIMLDSTTVKVHQHGSGAKKGAAMRERDAAGEG